MCVPMCMISGSVHPRVCGELVAPLCAMRCASTVHPRVCGELPDRGRDADPVVRFIPACAGNSEVAHDRLAGFCGSSPRVRGTRPPGSAPAPTARFIPACAGNSRSPSPAAPCSTVHPRVCGELVRRQVGDVLSARFIPACAGNSRAAEHGSHRDGGSSPRVRGTPRPGSSRRTAKRFIPACAGNSP